MEQAHISFDQPNFVCSQSCNFDVSYHFPEQLLRQFFKRADTDGDGRLSKPELRAAFAKLGALFPRFRANQAMARVDGNRDGYIDLDDNEQLDDLIKFAMNLGYRYIR